MKHAASPWIAILGLLMEVECFVIHVNLNNRALSYLPRGNVPPGSVPDQGVEGRFLGGFLNRKAHGSKRAPTLS